MKDLTSIYSGDCAFEEGEFEEMENETYDENLPLSAELRAMSVQRLDSDVERFKLIEWE